MGRIRGRGVAAIGPLTTTEVMRLTGLRRSGALKLLNQLCTLRECAVWFDEKVKVWRLMCKDEG